MFHVRKQLVAYLDGELNRRQQARVAEHLQRCERCAADARGIKSSMQSLQAELRQVALPEHTSARIRQLLSAGSTELPAKAPVTGADSRWMTAAVAMAVFVFVSVTVWILQPVHGGAVRLMTTDQEELPFESMARDTHLAFASRSGAVDYASSSPDDIRRWVEEQTHLRLTLVNEHMPKNRERYRVLGASRLTGPGGIMVAAVHYEIDSLPTTLLVAHQGAVPGAPRWSTGRKRVLYRPDENLNQLTWTNSGNAYSVVTELPDQGREACGMCHYNLPVVTGPVPDV